MGSAIIIYLDNLPIFGRTREKLISLLKRVLTKIIQGELKANKVKSRVGVAEVQFIGHLMNGFNK